MAQKIVHTIPGLPTDVYDVLEVKIGRRESHFMPRLNGQMFSQLVNGKWRNAQFPTLKEAQTSTLEYVGSMQ